jgi:restriction system protein
VVKKYKQTVWGIHAGKKDYARKLFLEGSVVAVGWKEMGNLAFLSKDKDVLKKNIQKVYFDKLPKSIPGIAGQIFRFVHVVRINDVIVYYSKTDQQVHIGVIVSGYKYKPKLNATFPNIRKVRWLKEVSRFKFSKRAFYEIGAALSFFKVNTNGNEFIKYIR